ncbi:MAG: Holliday junction resolvase RuvX [Ignavibacteriae bacterium]|nr:Holliday junction resolvase RuvX [Ignavibacteriota bacterium]
MDLPPLKGKRIAALDFGTKRIGLAVTDELHITISPRDILLTDAPELWDNIRRFIQIERLGAVVVGIPIKEDGSKTSIVKRIEKFILKLKTEIEIPVIEYDESFSTQAAFQTMIAGGMKKKQRRQKGMKDKIAAAVILRYFLEDYERFFV